MGQSDGREEGHLRWPRQKVSRGLGRAKGQRKREEEHLDFREQELRDADSLVHVHLGR